MRTERHEAHSLRKAGNPGRPNRKLHTCDRLRAPGTIIERWTNAKAALVGFLTGQGKSSREIAEILDDGTHDATIRALIARRWGLPEPGKPFLPVRLSWADRRKLEAQAAALHISPEEFAKRILSCAVADGLYQAVTDGRFDR